MFGTVEKQINVINHNVDELFRRLDELPDTFHLIRKQLICNVMVNKIPVHVSDEIAVLNRKIDLIMKHLHINIIDVAARPADMMVIDITTAEEKHHE